MKLNIIDYIIIILVIAAVAFAFIHITTDDSSSIKSTAYDISTINKLPENYFSYYKDGNIVKATVNGYNSTNNKEVTVNGTVEWIKDKGGTDVSILIQSDNQSYLAGLYKDVPQADIYIDKIILESDGEVYDNLYEFTLKGKEINSLKDLTSSLNNSDYEISTEIAIDSADILKIQKMENKVKSHNKKFAIEKSKDTDTKLILTRADSQNIKDADSVLGEFDGITDEITVRIYNCSENQIDSVKNNYNIINIRSF